MGQARRISAIDLIWIVIGAMLIQSAVIIAHEFAHSTTAWLLGYTSTPFTVIWGNPLTAMGWDEGVDYDRLFPGGGKPAEAMIGGMPLILHVAMLAISLYFLLRPGVAAKRWLFLTLFWLAVINLTELTAYFVMRPFLPTGDTGRFNAGFGLLPWILFVAGTAYVLCGLYLLCTRIIPVIDRWVGRIGHWLIVAISGFVMFLGGSGIRVMVSVWPDPLWMFGLIGIAGFAIWLWANRDYTVSS